MKILTMNFKINNNKLCKKQIQDKFSKLIQQNKQYSIKKIITKRINNNQNMINKD